MKTSRRIVAAFTALAFVAAACGSDSDTSPDTVAPATEAPAEDSTPDTAAPATEAPADAEPADTEPADEPMGDPFTVGIVTSTSGLLGSFGQEYVAGLEAGLAYATGGTGMVDGRPIEFEIIDDGSEPERAIAAASDLVGDGVNIIAGTVSSGIALQIGPFAEENGILYISGPAATDGITGLNRNTFRSGRQTFQDITAAAGLLDDVEGASIVVFAQDSAFGQANAAGVEAILGAAGAEVSSILVPLDANEFTPFAAQAIDAAPDLLFVAWAGDTAGAMWQSLQQQGVFEATTVATGLADRAVWPVYSDDPSGIAFLAHYFAEATDNEVNQFLIDNVEVADLFTPDGFVAAQMIVQALSEAGFDDVDGMIDALEGWTFDAPKGTQTIRASDHAMLQPMFTARLTNDGGEVTATLIELLDAEMVAPPEG